MRSDPNFYWLHVRVFHRKFWAEIAREKTYKESCWKFQSQRPYIGFLLKVPSSFLVWTISRDSVTRLWLYHRQLQQFWKSSKKIFEKIEFRHLFCLQKNNMSQHLSFFAILRVSLDFVFELRIRTCFLGWKRSITTPRHAIDLNLSRMSHKKEFQTFFWVYLALRLLCWKLIEENPNKYFFM